MKQLQNPIQHLLNQLSVPSARPRRLFALAGLPGSGKSTLAARLQERVNALASPNAMLSLSMDGFHLSKAQLRAFPDPDAAFTRRGAPWTFDVAALAQRLHEMRDNTGAVSWPAFEHAIGDPIENALSIAPDVRLILVEGLYLLHRENDWAKVSATFDERWYLNTPLDLALERLTRRHISAWNLTREQAQARIAANDGFNAQIVLNDRSHADWLLDDKA